MDIQFKFDDADVKRMLKEYGDAVAPATAAAINKTLRSVQSQTARKTAKAIGASVKAVKDRLTLPKFARASKHHLAGNLALWSRPLQASAFGKPSMRHGQATVKGPQGGRRIFPGSFVATMPSGHTSVFHRSTSSRLPIKEDTVPIEQIAYRIASSTFNHAVGERLAKICAQELNYRVRVKS